MNSFILAEIQLPMCMKKIQNRSSSQDVKLFKEQLDLPGHCKYLPVSLLRVEKNAIIFPGNKQISETYT